MDINQQVNEITDKVIEEQLPALVELHVTKMLGCIISDIFQSYSTTSKDIKRKIEEKLDVNLQKFDLIDYNALVAMAINDALVQQVNIQPILEMTKDAIGFINVKEIKLSEIIDLVKDHAMEYSNEAEGHISVYVNVNSQHEWIEVALDSDENTREQNCGVKFIFSNKNLNGGEIFSFHSGDYALKQGPVTPSKLTCLSRIEHKIFRLYSAGVKIINDVLDVDEYAYWSRYDN